MRYFNGEPDQETVTRLLLAVADRGWPDRAGTGLKSACTHTSPEFRIHAGGAVVYTRAGTAVTLGYGGTEGARWRRNRVTAGSR
jgi:hypothetical protein